MHQTHLSFPEIQLARRDGHKLRGYFANLFGEDSDLFHNHQPDGKVIYRYPRIQYKVVGGTPMLVGIGEGAKLLTERFLQLKQLDIDGLEYPLHQKHLKSEEVPVRVLNELMAYRFVNPWMPLNQENYARYLSYDEAQRQEQLKSILIRNLLNFLTVAGVRAEQRLMLHLDLKAPRLSKFKNQPVLTFLGSFVTNVYLPDHIGLGKLVSRGFGTIEKKRSSP